MVRKSDDVKKMSLAKVDFGTALLEGFLWILVLSGLAGLPLIKQQLTFGVFKVTFLVVLLFVFFTWFIIFRSKIQWTWNISFLVLFFILIANYWIYVPDVREDMMLEIIRTTIATNSMYQYNPATGRILELGIYPISKVITLPLVYSALVALTSVDVKIFLYYIVPIYLLILQFIVVGKWSQCLFEEHDEKRNIFFVFYAILLLFGDYMSLSYSYRLLHMGWRGDTIVMGICIPYVTCCCVEMLKNGIKSRNIISVLLCLMASVFVAPLKISVGLQGFVIMVFILIFLMRRWSSARINKIV